MNMNTVLLLAHEGHQHGPDPGLVALLVAGAVLVVLLLAGMVRQRVGRRRADPWRPSAQSSSASSDAARAAPSDSTGR
jgi:hypothetical protein